MTPTTTSTRYLRTTTSCRSSASSAESRSSTRWWPSAATTSARSVRCSTTRRARGATPAGCRPTESSILPKKLLQGWRNRSMRPTSPTTTMTPSPATFACSKCLSNRLAQSKQNSWFKIKVNSFEYFCYSQTVSVIQPLRLTVYFYSSFWQFLNFRHIRENHLASQDLIDEARTSFR